MSEGRKGQAGKTALLSLMALAPLLAGASPARAQDTGTPAPAPSSRPLDFRLPPADDGRTPGVQGPTFAGRPRVPEGQTFTAAPETSDYLLMAPSEAEPGIR